VQLITEAISAARIGEDLIGIIQGQQSGTLQSPQSGQPPLRIAAEIVDKKDGREMSAWTEYDLKRQFERAKKNSWIKTFKSAAATCQFPPEVLMAIASRETNMRNIIGDGGHGYGVMQIDDRSFPE
jgi:hypothetical protein